MSLIDADLRQFCSTGAFGPIAIGMTKAQVEQILGRPQGWGGSWPTWPDEKHQQAAQFILPYTEYPIWKYDAIEFHFGDSSSQLFFIWCDHLEQLTSNGQTFQLQLWLFDDTKPISLEPFRRSLHDEGIPFEDRIFPYGGRILLTSGVEICYDDRDQELVGIGKYEDLFAK